MKVSNTGLTLIKKWEGFYPNAYRDPVGVWTIGFGTTKWENGKAVKQGEKITQTEALRLLEKQVNQHAETILIYVNTELNQNQFDALASFQYNLGKHILAKDSALVGYLNKRDWDNATRVMKLYNKAGGKVFQGLINRREEETKLFLKGIIKPIKHYVVVGGFERQKALELSNELKAKGYYNIIESR